MSLFWEPSQRHCLEKTSANVNKPVTGCHRQMMREKSGPGLQMEEWKELERQESREGMLGGWLLVVKFRL